MNISDLFPAVSLRQEFTLRDHRFVPARPGCYALSNYQGDILYIGKSKNLSRRMGQHLNNKTKTRPLPFWFHFLPCEVAELDKIETGWINGFKIRERGNMPYFNKIAPPI